MVSPGLLIPDSASSSGARPIASQVAVDRTLEMLELAATDRRS